MNFINKSIIKILGIALLFNLAACHNHDHEDGGHSHGEDDGHGHALVHTAKAEHHEEGKIYLSADQVKTVNVELGDFSAVKINDFVGATGTLGLPPNAYSSVSAKANGFIKNSNKFVEGSYVKKGAVIAYLENPDFIKQQQAYLEVVAELAYLRQELNRQQSLVDANAGVTKNLQKLQSDVNVKTATQKGIARQLSYLGINVDKLSPENIVQRIAITSPISGYITSINMHNGMFVEPNMELMEIVNETHLHLELDVFEKDIASIKEDQKITYTVPALGNDTYEGGVHVIGKEFNRENKTVRVHGHLEKERPRFIKDLFIEAKIWLNDQTMEALPEEAIIKDGPSSYIYVAKEIPGKDEFEFEPLMVMPGNTDKGFTSVKLIDVKPKNVQIVTRGAYYVYAQSKVATLEHSH